jgi:peptidoglycan/xylan/chitin deacetylase (PgdA/CDA1 family)
MLRSLGKSCFAYAYTWGDAARRVVVGGRRAPAIPFIACYHRVVENFDRSRRATIPSMLISTSMLERHIDWMAKRFSLVSLDDLGHYLERGKCFPKPPAAITFDDGYSDVYHHAYPMLMRKGIPAAVFVVTGLIGTRQPQIWDRFYLLLRRLYLYGAPLAETVAEALRAKGFDASRVQSLSGSANEPFHVMGAVLNALPQDQIESLIDRLEEIVHLKRDQMEDIAPLTWTMIETMHRGGIEFGSHTISHPLLTNETLDTARSELLGSKLMLEERLNTPVHHFAYPDGRFNPVVVQAVKAAGYRYAFGICHSRDENLPLLTIPRKVLWERSCLNMLGRFSSSVMNCQTHWVFGGRGRCEHDHFTIYEARTNGRIA